MLAHICKHSIRMTHSRGRITWGSRTSTGGTLQCVLASWWRINMSVAVIDCIRGLLKALLYVANVRRNILTNILTQDHTGTFMNPISSLYMHALGLYTYGMKSFTHMLTYMHAHAYIHIHICSESQVQRLVVSVLFLCCGLWACLRGWSMVFYCFPRIIGRVHRRGRQFIRAQRREREREREGERESGEGTERKGERDGGRGVWGGGVSVKMEGKIGEGRGKGGRKNSGRGENKTERERRENKMETEGRRGRCADVLVIPHHLEMCGKDNGTDIDEYHMIKRWSVGATSDWTLLPLYSEHQTHVWQLGVCSSEKQQHK